MFLLIAALTRKPRLLSSPQPAASKKLQHLGFISDLFSYTNQQTASSSSSASSCQQQVLPAVDRSRKHLTSRVGGKGSQKTQTAAEELKEAAPLSASPPSAPPPSSPSLIDTSVYFFIQISPKIIFTLN